MTTLSAVRRSITICGIALLLGTGTVLAQAFPPPPPGVVAVPSAPPPPRVEVVPPPPPGRAAVVVWRAGHWRWNGFRYVWVRGRYVVHPRHATVWVEGHWDSRPYGWVWIEGHWRP